MSRIYSDFQQSSHHSSPSPNGSLANAAITNSKRPGGKVPQIAIVGAGISGLRCADILIQAGANVTIYEARDRVGGRVHQIMSGGHLMDMGANWIHGTENNPIADIATRTQTATHVVEHESVLIDQKGHVVDPALASEISDAVWGIIFRAFQYSDQNCAEIDASDTLLDYFKRQIPEITQDSEKQSLMLEAAHMWGAFVGEPIDRQSLKYFFLEECIDGENAFVGETYKKIIAEIAAVAMDKADLHFNEEVTFLDWNQEPGRGRPGVTIHTDKGTRKTYDEVVLTSPLGWLKRHKLDAFPSESPLPPNLLQAIDGISYGRLEKVYLTFLTAFWQTPADQPERSAPISSKDTTSSSHPASTISAPHSTHTHFLSPTYHPHPPSTPWNQTLFNLASFPSTASAHPTLLFYLYGDCGAHLISLLNSTTQAPGPYAPNTPQYAILNTFFKPYYSLLPSFNPTSSSCHPTSILPTTWQLDPLAGNGSYTHIAAGSAAADTYIEALREGVGGPETGLWFAGEHTAPFIALGTTTGAYWSGESVARRILGGYQDLRGGGRAGAGGAA